MNEIFCFYLLLDMITNFYGFCTIRFNMDPEWAETGDRYLLKLFRDYVFHHVTETGEPWIDLAHIVACLNKV